MERRGVRRRRRRRRRRDYQAPRQPGPQQPPRLLPESPATPPPPPRTSRHRFRGRRYINIRGRRAVRLRKPGRRPGLPCRAQPQSRGWERRQRLPGSGRAKNGPRTSPFGGGEVAARRAGESGRRRLFPSATRAALHRLGSGLALVEQLQESVSGAGAGLQMRKFEVARRSEKWRCS